MPLDAQSRQPHRRGAIDLGALLPTPAQARALALFFDRGFAHPMEDRFQLVTELVDRLRDLGRSAPAGIAMESLNATMARINASLVQHDPKTRQAQLGILAMAAVDPLQSLTSELAPMLQPHFSLSPSSLKALPTPQWEQSYGLSAMAPLPPGFTLLPGTVCIDVLPAEHHRPLRARLGYQFAAMGPEGTLLRIRGWTTGHRPFEVSGPGWERVAGFSPQTTLDVADCRADLERSLAWAANRMSEHILAVASDSSPSLCRLTLERPGAGLQTMEVTSLGDLLSNERRFVIGVDCSSCNLDDVSALGDYGGLRFVALNHNPRLRQVSALAQLPALAELQLRDTGISSLAFAKDMTGLEQLDISQCLVSTLEPLRQHPTLRMLWTRGCARIGEWSALGSIAQLALLNASRSSLDDREFDHLPNTRSLRTLEISDTNVTRLETLREHTGLESLALRRTQVADLSGLEGAGLLRTLRADQSRISSIAVIAKLQHLQDLSIRDTTVAGLDPVTQHPALLELDISGTPIRDLTPLHSVQNLRRLVAENNPDIPPIEFHKLQQANPTLTIKRGA